MNYKIVNIIANTNLHERLNLTKIRESFEDVEYEPEIYFAAIYRLKNPKCSILLNSSGKIIFSGATSIKDIEDAREILLKKLRNLGYSPAEDAILIQNIVVLVKIPREIDFNRISANDLKMNLELKFDKSRCVIKNKKPKFTAIIFRTGKCLIAGLKDENTITAVLKFLKTVSQ
jgi:transcription initiation factor TFIID TATA-box-binding protein